ncbi:MAG: Trk system potassium transporter TrkA [Clostridium sp.]|jgi:trk system potassium uptake protein TrkA|nr:Trk system potassium transporter TrkA [Clostridium sp.]
MKALIVGAGKLGGKLASQLSGGDTLVTVMDSDPEVLERIADHLDVMIVRGSGMHVETLKELNIEEYDLVIAVTESDETNMVICSIAKKLGCKKSIARVRNPEYSTQNELIRAIMDIDYIVNPELATANEINRNLLYHYSLYSGDFAEGRIMMLHFNASSLPGFVGKRIKEIKNINGILIGIIWRNGEIIIPRGEDYIMEDDVLYVIGKKDNINQLAKTCKTLVQIKYIKKVMVLGGGRIGYYLAEKLISQGISVKLIEHDKERCEYLSENLNDTLVICGDGTDINLLNDEDISSMDAFVGVTGYDEENLLMTLMAKQLGVKKVIAKVSKSSYVQVIEKLGVDIAVSPIDITASDILKYIRGGRAASVSLLLGGKAEVTEVIAEKDMWFVEKPISELALPKGIIIGAVDHKGKVIIPTGNTVIYPGDRFVILSSAIRQKALEEFFRSF